ncbi:hypothetical protein CONPUDRAFT_66284, partial [Coniophora puteana RWD-64-598 SS2]
VIQDNPLIAYLPHQQKFLDELLRWEGWGNQHPDRTCSECGKSEAAIRCTDCFCPDVWCDECVVRLHERTPLHRIQRWNGEFFERTTLGKLNLRLRVGHTGSGSCQTYESQTCTIIDTTGTHEIVVDFCGCPSSPSDRVTKFLRSRLFPATTSEPQTAVTFRLLEFYHILAFESKASAYEVYHTLVRLTDNCGSGNVSDRYRAFMRVAREWACLKMLKRSGRGHDPGGIASTPPGSCAVLCPACPQPGKNLPDDWRTQPPSKQWIYSLFIGLDANFRLKRKEVSSANADPSLSGASAYFVDESVYQRHITENENARQEKSTCVNHNAVNLANLKSTKGLAVTGVGTVDCTRHNMKRPCSVGDLQHWERYYNMDFLILSSLSGDQAQVIVISYDIACQWSLHFLERIRKYFHISDKVLDGKKLVFLVPKFHLPAHVERCQIEFSFNLAKWVGRTDGEAPERGWSNINPVAVATKENGPGARHDTLNAHFGDYNWKKICGIHEILSRKMDEALSLSKVHQEQLEDMNIEGLKHHIIIWEAEMSAWEEDHAQPNPFQPRVRQISQATVRLQLARAEAEELLTPSGGFTHTEMSPSSFVAGGLDLEESIRKYSLEVADLGNHATDSQKTKLQLTSNSIRRKFADWTAIQLLYMPVVPSLRGTTDADDLTAVSPSALQLYLPSDLPSSTACDSRLISCEWDLRFAQAHDALAEVRQYLRVRSFMLGFKDRFLRGQGANTRARESLKVVERRIKKCAYTYRNARTSLKSLASRLSKPGWDNTLHELSDGDIRSMGDYLQGETEGRTTLSWIWVDKSVANSDDPSVQDGLRVQWCKARARASRWTEETILLKEEMRRVLQFLDWQGEWWKANAECCSFKAEAYRDGAMAYALRQASIRRAIGTRFATKFSSYLQVSSYPL